MDGWQILWFNPLGLSGVSVLDIGTGNDGE
jgi:hypothetical protein